MDTAVQQTEAIQQFIKQRKKQLIEQAFQYMGNSKHLTKINKEAYYYSETIKNYKQMFSDTKKSEEALKRILCRIPAFQKFVQKNSVLASMFNQSNGVTSNNVAPSNMPGLQTRSSVQALMQERISSGGANALQQVQENIKAGKDELTKLKIKLLNSSVGNGDGTMPDFKPNMQKSKTFMQRVEIATNLQSTKGNSYLPAKSDIALTIGYKLNDKSLLGIGLSYKVGWGTSLNRVGVSHQGMGLRSFVDYKLKKSFYMSGGYELNFQRTFNNIQELNRFSSWQQAFLMGISKQVQLRGRKAKLQLLYDFLNNRHVPVTQPLIYRIAYNLK